MRRLVTFIAVLTVVATSTNVAGQDREFLAALERAQKERPQTLSATARIAPENEPGDPLVVHGRAVAEDGRTPIAGAVIFAYHTDRNGLYNSPGSGPHSWRLRGWVRTNADGSFEFRTIRPGAYPGNKVPQHIHLNMYVPDGRRYWADELQFADDPLVPPADRAKAVRIRREGDTQHVDFTFRARAANKF
jgi:protocatechuate 3,4-dioxygenase beta subunit